MEKKFIFDDKTAIVETEKGKVRGYFYDDMYIFKGIPYAKAKRFHAPEPADAWDDVMTTINYGHVCPLLDEPQPGIGEMMVPHRYWPMSENCLNLNIWTPGLDGEKRPVMVWLHGGGFFAGSSIEQIAYEGENMCKLGQVVVVSVNHRLNVLGYCDLSAFGEEYANSGNAGTDDLVAALRWLHNNVEKFGGDPENVAARFFLIKSLFSATLLYITSSRVCGYVRPDMQHIVSASLNVWKLSIGVPNAFSKSDIFTSPAREAVIYFTALSGSNGARALSFTAWITSALSLPLLRITTETPCAFNVSMISALSILPFMLLCFSGISKNAVKESTKAAFNSSLSPFALSMIKQEPEPEISVNSEKHS